MNRRGMSLDARFRKVNDVSSLPTTSISLGRDPVSASTRPFRMTQPPVSYINKKVVIVPLLAIS